jgi:hypothetical protein
VCLPEQRVHSVPLENVWAVPVVDHAVAEVIMAKESSTNPHLPRLLKSPAVVGQICELRGGPSIDMQHQPAAPLILKSPGGFDSDVQRIGTRVG